MLRTRQLVGRRAHNRPSKSFAKVSRRLSFRLYSLSMATFLVMIACLSLTACPPSMIGSLSMKTSLSMNPATFCGSELFYEPAVFLDRAASLKASFSAGWLDGHLGRLLGPSLLNSMASLGRLDGYFRLARWLHWVCSLSRLDRHSQVNGVFIVAIVAAQSPPDTNASLLY
jgi:hypothetical protein